MALTTFLKTLFHPQILAYANTFGIAAAPSSVLPDDVETQQRVSYLPIQFSTIVTKLLKTVLNSSNEKVPATLTKYEKTFFLDTSTFFAPLTSSKTNQTTS